MTKILEMEEFRTLTSYLSSQEAQKKIIEILEKHDALRSRVYIEKAIEKVSKGEVHAGSFAYTIHEESGLPIESSVNIALDLLGQVFDKRRNELNAIMLEKHHNEGRDDIEEIKKQPIGLKDIFEEHEKVMDDDIQVVDVKDETLPPPRVTSDQEKNAMQEMMSVVAIDLNDDQKRRLESVLLTRLKNIRDPVDTRLTLSRSLDTGGVGLSDTDASNVSLMTEDYLKHNWPPPFNPTVPITEEKKNVSVNIEELVAKDETKEPKSILDDTPDRKTQFEKTLRQKARSHETESIREKRRAVLDNIESEERTSTHAPPLPSKKKPNAPRLIGPADELRDMTIDDFRTLYKNEDDGKRGIRAHIERLGKDSFGKKLEGIKAWRNGNIMKLYLQIGKQSIEQERSVKDVITDLKEHGKPYLTDDEFHAIMELNKEIRLLA